MSGQPGSGLIVDVVIRRSLGGCRMHGQTQVTADMFYANAVARVSAAYRRYVLPNSLWSGERQLAQLRRAPVAASVSDSLPNYALRLHKQDNTVLAGSNLAALSQYVTKG